MNEFVVKVARMRRMQNRYYKMKDPLSLAAAKEAEKQVDADLVKMGCKTKHDEDDGQSKLF